MVQVEVRPRSTRLAATCEDEQTSGGGEAAVVVAGREKIANVEEVVLDQAVIEEAASFRYLLEQT